MHLRLVSDTGFVWTDHTSSFDDTFIEEPLMLGLMQDRPLLISNGVVA